MTIICVHLCSSVVNNKIGIIPACFHSAYALSMGWEWCEQAVASGVGDCCRWWVWLLKYNSYEILQRKARKRREVNATTSLRSLRPLRCECLKYRHDTYPALTRSLLLNLLPAPGCSAYRRRPGRNEGCSGIQ